MTFEHGVRLESVRDAMAFWKRLVSRGWHWGGRRRGCEVFPSPGTVADWQARELAKGGYGGRNGRKHLKAQLFTRFDDGAEVSGWRRL